MSSLSMEYRLDSNFTAQMYRDGREVITHLFFKEEAQGIRLQNTTNKVDAKMVAKHWTQRFYEHGAPKPEEVVDSKCRNWSTLYRTRLAVLSSLFLSISGSVWVDGYLMEDDMFAHQRQPRNHPHYAARIAEIAKYCEPRYGTDRSTWYRAEIYASMEEERPIKFSMDWLGEVSKPHVSLPPEPDGDGPVRLYRVQPGYSRITRVPDDVRPEWLAAAVEVAIAMRDRDSNDENQKFGAFILDHWKSRFPSLQEQRP